MDATHDPAIRSTLSHLAVRVGLVALAVALLAFVTAATTLPVTTVTVLGFAVAVGTVVTDRVWTRLPRPPRRRRPGAAPRHPPAEVAALERALSTAEAARHAKGALLAHMAHEVRSPLSAMLGLVGLLQDTQLSPDQRDMVGILQRSAEGLIDLVTNTLDLAKLEAGRLDLEPRPFGVHAWIEECLDLMAARAAEKDVDLAYTVAPGVPAQLRGDPLRLRQVLVNLLSNAVKFTDEGEIIVALTGTARRDGRYELGLMVSDSGAGIPAERLGDILNPFTQGSSAVQRTHGGTGLGLAICRELTQLMEGHCRVTSTLGQGTTVHCSFVVQTVADSPRVQSDEHALAGRRILVADDNPTIARLLADVIRSWGAEVETATTTGAAVALVRSDAKYDALLVDARMTAADGRSIATTIRRLPGKPAAPVVLLTDLTGEAELEARSRGATSYVAKPVKPTRLLAALRRASERDAAHAGTPHVSAAIPAPACDESRAPVLQGVRVLLADDDASLRRTIERLLVREGAVVTAVADGQLALEALAEAKPDVIVIDAQMPRLDGFTVCQRLKADPTTRLIPVIIATGLPDEERARGIEAGADDVIGKPFGRAHFVARVRALARLKGFTDQLEPVEAVLIAMARCIEGKDSNTHGHCERLSEYASRLGRRVGLDEADIEALRLAGIVHDIGKIAVPDAVLLKPGPLDEAEWEIMRQHPLEGQRICSGLASFQRVLPIIRHHHEKRDGTGYPDGLRGEDIPMTARVLQVVDVFDAMTTARPYRTAVSKARALELMQAEVERGWWDPEIFAAFRTLIEEELVERDSPQLEMAGVS